jgi:hypothetical protein
MARRKHHGARKNSVRRPMREYEVNPRYEADFGYLNEGRQPNGEFEYVEEGRRPRREIEYLNSERRNYGTTPRYERMYPEYTSSRQENHSGREMDAWEFKAHRRGLEQEGQRKSRILGYSDFYSGADARRTQEMQDAGMIRENPYAIANMPQEVMIKSYPRTGPYIPEVLDDTIAGVDRQMDYDDYKREDNFYPKKV